MATQKYCAALLYNTSILPADTTTWYLVFYTYPLRLTGEQLSLAMNCGMVHYYEGEEVVAGVEGVMLGEYDRRRRVRRRGKTNWSVRREVKDKILVLPPSLTYY